MNIEFIIEVYVIENMNPNYNIIPCFVEKLSKTTLKVCPLSKQSMWFSIASMCNSSAMVVFLKALVNLCKMKVI
jgi:hypothetical protein